MINSCICKKNIAINKWNSIKLPSVSVDTDSCEGVWAKNRFNVMYSGKFITSKDGISWDIKGTSDIEILSKKIVFYADTLDKYVVYYPDDDRGYLSISSDDGESFITGTLDFNVKKICKSPKGRYFIATDLGLKVTDDFESFATISNTERKNFICIASSPGGMMASGTRSLYYCGEAEDEWKRINADDIVYDIASIGYINNLYIIGTVGSKVYNCSTYNPQFLHEINTPVSFFDNCLYDGSTLYIYHEAPRSYLTTVDGYKFTLHQQKSEVNGTLMKNDKVMVVVGQGCKANIGIFIKEPPVSVNVEVGDLNFVINPKNYSETENHEDIVSSVNGKIGDVVLNSQDVGAANKVIYTATIGNEWQEEVTGGFSQVINIDGILEEDSPIVDIILDDDVLVSQSQIRAWSDVSRIKTQDGFINVYCYERKPTIAMNIQLICIR